MFTLATLIGLYSYSIFLLGLLHLLSPSNILVVSAGFFLTSLFNLRTLKLPKFSNFSRLLFGLIIFQCLVNLVGALGPEIGFDALWYHLTLPKIWLQHGQLLFIPGSQFKYSVMPMLTEMFYFIFPGKFIHYLFGLLSLIVTFKLARKFLNLDYSLLAAVIFSANLVFGWQSTSAYIDLARTFFESLALYLFLDEKPDQSAITLGLAVCTKLLSITSLPIFLFLLYLKSKNLKSLIRYSLFVILIVTPWLVRAYIATSNPIYPFFTPLYTDTHISLDPRNLLTLLTHSVDPLNPVYFLILILLAKFKFSSHKIKLLTLYSLLSIVVWIFTPNSGGGRFILPYLPALSVLSSSVIYHLRSKILVSLVIILSLFSITYRFAANIKYLQPKEVLLSQKLNFNFGDYYDFDHHFQPSDRVLPLGINNLYYLNANIALAGDPFDYILVRGQLPRNYTAWKLISQNAITKTQVYERSR